MALFTFTFLILSLTRAYSTSNPCIDTNLSLGFSFIESVKLCQTTYDSPSAIASSPDYSVPSKKLAHTTRSVPAHVFDLTPQTTATPTLINVHSNMPYLVAASSIFSVITITSKSFLAGFYCLVTWIF